MPYVSKVEAERAHWITLAEAVAHVRNSDGCDAKAAEMQLRKALGDGALFLRWEDERPTPLMPGGGATIAPDRPGRDQAYWQSAQVRAAEVFDPPDGVLTDAGRAAVAARTYGRWRVLLLLRATVEALWAAAPTGQKSRRAAQPNVDRWILAVYSKAKSDGSPTPKRAQVFRDCRAATHATEAQMKEAIRQVPSDLKRARGGRDRARGDPILKSDAEIGR